MSFQDLVGSGSACSTGNSAMKFVDHLDKNKFNVSIIIFYLFFIKILLTKFKI